MTARQTLLDGLARDAGIFELVSELAPLHPRDNTFPGEVFLHLAADALDWCGASRSGPLALEGLREQFLPECTFRGRNAGRRGPGVYQKRCVAPPSGHPAMTVSPGTRGQSLAFAAWRCCGRRPGLADLRRQPAPA